MKDWIETLKQLISPQGLKSSEPEPGVTAHFLLKLDILLVGELTLAAGEWSFQYSVHFKHQDAYKPLLEFPDVEKVYRSKELWPFFAFRIPGLSQPHAKAVIKKHNIDENNITELLKAFGRKSINNPFVLEPQPNS